jgi:phospholipid/cholesterol/gamma-HCH transport system substrate-binding protein
MPRLQGWRDLLLGIGVLAAMAAAAAFVLVFARVGALHGRTIRLLAAVPDATGVLPGTEVWLAGQKIGLVKSVDFRSPNADPQLRILLALDVLAEYRPQIRRGAKALVRPGTSLIGAPVVALSAPRGTAAPVQDGDTLFADPAIRFESIRTRATTAANTELPVILDNLRVLAVQLRSAQGTLGALGVAGTEQLAATSRVLEHVAERASAAQGTVGAARTGPLPRQARAILGRLDVIRARLGSRVATPGRIRGDSALLRAVDSLRTDLTAVQRLADSPDGTAGRLRHDPALRQQFDAARAELDALAADARRNPLRYVAF